MLNAEKYRKEIIDRNYRFGLSDHITKCAYEQCDTCLFSIDNNAEDCLKTDCTVRRTKWLLSEYKEHTKLTKLKFELLKFWYKQGYKYIARDRDNTLFIYKDKPSKLAEYWANLYHYSLDDNFRNLFEFVEWEDKEPTSIQEVLDNCEVIGNESK